MIKNAREAGADNNTPSVPQYFSWINNTNEGSTEKQTLVNLDFFRYLKDKYGMQIKIYAWDAGNFDGASEGYGNLKSEKFRNQYPEGYKNIVKKAESLGIRMGLWGSPDGYGNDEKTEKERYDFFVHLCRDYNFALFKLDGVCGYLRPEKAALFSQMLTECRKYSPDLIVLNHRLDLYEAEKNVTTYLFNGEETYVDVFAHNQITAMHNRAFMFSRGCTDGLERLAEDHGVCLSSSLDYFEDDLIYQAFGRCLILAPEIYGNPWLLRDEEYPKLARVYNLHRRNAAVLVNGIKLSSDFGCDAVSRGNKSKRFICTGNDTWVAKRISVPLDKSIGLETDEKIVVALHSPYEKKIGVFEYGSTVSVELMPFRATLIEISAESCAEPVSDDIVYEVITEEADGTPKEIKILKDSNIDIIEKAPVYLGTLDKTEYSPLQGEKYYETAVFAANNDSLEARCVKMSGDTGIPEVRACRDLFFGQETYVIRGCENRFMFDGNERTFFDGKSRTYQQNSLRVGDGCLRIDFGNVYDADRVEIVCFSTDAPTPEILPQLIPEKGGYSTDLENWNETDCVQSCVVSENENMRVVKTRVHTVYDNPGKKIKLTYSLNEKIRYFRLPCPPDRIFSVRLFSEDIEIIPVNPYGNNLQMPYGDYTVKFAKHGSVILPSFRKGSRLAVAVNGKHGDEGAWVCVGKNGKLSGCPNRAPEFKGNVWEHRVTEQDENYTYFYPLDSCTEGDKLDITAVFNDGEPKDFNVEVWLCDVHN